METLIKKYPQLGAVILGVIVFVVFYYFGSRNGKAAAAGNDEGAAEQKAAEQANPLTYELSQYTAMADRLESAMFQINTDEPAVYDVFSKLRNKADMLKLNQVFGNRRQLWTWGGSNLARWISDQLDPDEIEHVNEILARNNIDYQY